jgi:large subunit ribosomal protein L22
MISRATSRFIRMSPQKARLVVDLIRGKDVNEALMTLKFTNKPKSTREIEKVVKSAVANATEEATRKNESIDVDNLFVEKCFINEGPRLKRIRPAPMGRAYRYQRRTSHITIELGERK